MTPVRASRSFVLRHKQSFVSLGSCFAESMGQRLARAQVQGQASPYGTLFHPFAIFDRLRRDELLPDLFLTAESRVRHYRLPSRLSADSPEDLTARVRELDQAVRSTLEKPQTFLLLTLGTAHLYTKEREWVANCHKQPGRLFQKNLSTLDELTADWERTSRVLPPDLKIVVTVSPVRHLKDGLSESMLSKSLLRVLAHQMVASDPQRIDYFPAYEIMLDELRDYRFYERDMLHPSEQALDIIWQRFLEAYFLPDDRKSFGDIEAFRQKLQHRFQNPSSPEALRFLDGLLAELRKWQAQGLPFASEEEALFKRLKALGE